MEDHGLELGSLDLVLGSDNDDGYSMHVLAEGTTFGSAQAVVREIASMLADGNHVRYDRAGNRVVVFDVEIEGPDGIALQAGEVALRRELYRPNTVTWTPPTGLSAPTVFEVITSEMAPVFDDIEETLGRRVFRVTLTCAPHARGLNLVTVPALASGTTSATIDTCDSMTGWSATRGSRAATPQEGPFAWAAGAVGVAELDSANGFPPERWTLTRTGTVNFATLPYLQIQVSTLANGAPLDVAAYAGATRLPVVEARRMSDNSGKYLVTFDASGLALVGIGSVPSLTFVHNSAAGYGHVWQGLIVHNVAQTDIPPGLTTRQLSRTIATGGTERTPASLHVYSNYDMANMQMLVVHSHPEDGTGYAPSLRRWRKSGNAEVAAEGDTLSLKREAMKPLSSTCEVPNSALPTDGYVLALRVQSSVTTLVGIDWAVQTFFPTTTTTMEGVTEGTTPWKPREAGKYEIVPLATLTLPTIRGFDGTTRVSFRCLASDADLFWDEAFLFRVGDDCALTIIDENVADHVWLEAPSGETPVPTLWEGFAADRSSARHPGSRVKSMGSHVLHPDGTVVHAAAITNELKVEATYHRRWHSNAAE